jgi:hypothetical protein
MPNAWVIHVRKFAEENGLSYGCAMSTPECKATYKRKSPEPYKKEMDQLSTLIRERKLDDASELFMTLLPLVKVLPESEQKEKYMLTLSTARKNIRNLKARDKERYPLNV